MRSLVCFICLEAFALALGVAALECGGGEVPRVQSLEGSSPSFVVAHRHAVVLEGSVAGAAAWGAVGRWSSERLAAALGSTQVEYRSSAEPVFTIRSPSRTGDTLQCRGDAEQDRVVTFQQGSVADMLAAAETGQRFTYFSSELKLPPALESDVRGWETFSVVDEEASAQATSHRVFHVGVSGVTAQLHYDRSRNFLVQLQGRKKVTLFAPEAHWALRVFPSVHPSRRQSQLSLDGLEVRDAGLARELAARCRTTVLNPGDVLYIPPFTFHNVEYLEEFSVSLSVISPSTPEFRFADVVHTPLPFAQPSASGQQQRRQQDVTDLRAFLLAAIPDAAAFFANLTESRFGGLDIVESDDAHVCEALDGKTGAMRPEVAVAARAVRALLKELGEAQGFRPEAHMLLADHVEELARRAVGVQNVHSFLLSLSRL